MVAQLLDRAGVFLGDELIGANPSNPYGHFEDREFVDLHKTMMSDADASWHVDDGFVPMITARRWRQMAALVERRTVEHRLWGFKDPRVCFYLGAWKHLLPAMKVVAVFRDPAECAHSLKRRHARDLARKSGPLELHRKFWVEPDHALSMWVAYNSAMLDYVIAHRDDTLVFSFHDLSNGLPLIDAINRTWDLELDPVRTFEVFDPSVTTTPQSRQPVYDISVVDRLEDVWDRLQVYASADGDRIRELSR